MSDHGGRGGTGAFEEALRALSDPDAELRPGLLGQLSSASRGERRVWAELWPQIDPERRRRIARQMFEAAEADFQLDFRPLFALALEDADAEVRALAVDGLWESQDVALIDRFALLMREDPSAHVRARAAAALGQFVQLAELEEIAMARVESALRGLLDTATDEGEAVDVRRRAVESAGFADRVAVRNLLSDTVRSLERPLRAGALRAMGRSADERWAETVISFLDDPEPELRFEAARAAGELILEDAVAQLAELALDDEYEIRLEAIWALGEIGGERPQRVLERMTAEDEAMAEAIEDALAMVALNEGQLRWDMLGAVDPSSDDVLDEWDIVEWEAEPDDDEDEG